MIFCNFIKYLVLENPNFLGSLVNMGVAMWLVIAGLKTHRALSSSYIRTSREVKERRHVYRPLCIQGARGAMIYGACYIVAVYHWQLKKHWLDIGAPEDMAWLTLELIGMMTLLHMLKIGRVIIAQNTERRRNTERCPDEGTCPVRTKCLKCK